MPIAASDVVDFQTAVSQNDDVEAAYALRHARLHDIASASDHSDVGGTPSDGDVFAWVDANSQWEPVVIVATADGGTYA